MTPDEALDRFASAVDAWRRVECPDVPTMFGWLAYDALRGDEPDAATDSRPRGDHAPSDGPNMIPLDRLEGIVRVALDVWQSARAGGTAPARSQGGRAAVEDRARAVPPARART